MRKSINKKILGAFDDEEVDDFEAELEDLDTSNKVEEN